MLVLQKKKNFIRTKLKIPIVSISKWREKTWIKSFCSTKNMSGEPLDN